MTNEEIKVISEMIMAYHQEAVAPLSKELKQVVSILEEMMKALSAGCKCSDGGCCD